MTTIVLSCTVFKPFIFSFPFLPPAIHVSAKNTLAVNKLQPKIKNGHVEKDVKSKMSGQGKHSDSADGNKILINAIQAAKYLVILITFCSLNCDY